MGSMTLRTRLTLLLATTIGVATLLSAIAYLTNSGADNRLETAFVEELAVMSELPEHRGRLREVDLMTDNYLLTHDARWLARRRAAIAVFTESHIRLGRLIHEPKEALAWKEILPAFRRYISHQDGIVAQERAGGLSTREATSAAMANDEVNGLIRNIKPVRQAELPGDRLAAARRPLRRPGHLIPRPRLLPLREPARLRCGLTHHPHPSDAPEGGVLSMEAGRTLGPLPGRQRSRTPRAPGFLPGHGRQAQRAV